MKVLTEDTPIGQGGEMSSPASGVDPSSPEFGMSSSNTGGADQPKFMFRRDKIYEEDYIKEMCKHLELNSNKTDKLVKMLTQKPEESASSNG
jgi:hypothetical protein